MRIVSSSTEVTIDDNIILVDCSNGAVNLTFPDPIFVPGVQIIIKKIDSTSFPMVAIGIFDGYSNPSFTVQYSGGRVIAFDGKWWGVGSIEV